MAFLTASQAMDSVVRFDGHMCGVSPTPTIQTLSVSAPIFFLLFLRRGETSSLRHLPPDFLHQFAVTTFVLALRRTETNNDSV